MPVSAGRKARLLASLFIGPVKRRAVGEWLLYGHEAPIFSEETPRSPAERGMQPQMSRHQTRPRQYSLARIRILSQSPRRSRHRILTVMKVALRLNVL